METVVNFLINNGFKKDPHDSNTFINKHCNITLTGYCYDIVTNDGDFISSDDYNIYWLIGYLTYYGYINKNYKL